MMITLLLCLFTRLSTRSLGLPFYMMQVHALKPLSLSSNPAAPGKHHFTLLFWVRFHIQVISYITDGWRDLPQPKKQSRPVLKVSSWLPYHLSSLMCLRKILNLQMLQFFVTAVLKETVMPLPECYIPSRNYVSYLLINPYTVYMSL